MKVEISHHVDASEADAEGFHDYHYEYDVFVFSEATTSFVVRAYTEDEDKAHFVAREEAGQRHLLTERDLLHPLFLQAQAHLHALGKTDLSWLDSDRSAYRSLDAKNPC